MGHLERLDVVRVRWGVFSLAIANFSGEIADFDPERGRSIAALRTAIAVRDDYGNDALGRYYAELGHRIFDELADAGDVDVLRASLEAASVDPDVHDRAVADPATWTSLLTEHQALVSDTRSFGVPTIRLDNGSGPAIFGPVISNPPDSDDEAVELWRHVSWLTRYDNFSELKRDRTVQPDLELWRERVLKS